MNFFSLIYIVLNHFILVVKDLNSLSLVSVVPTFAISGQRNILPIYLI